MTQHLTDQDRVWSLIEDIRLCMFVSHDGSGDALRARPMDAHASREEDAIWFLSDVRAQKDDEIAINDNVCLTFADNAGYRYVSITGAANVVDDRRKIEELWTPANKAFWDSKDDPNIRVLRVRPTMAEFWESPGKIVTMVKMATAAVTGAKPELGENRKVAL